VTNNPKSENLICIFPHLLFILSSAASLLSAEKRQIQTTQLQTVCFMTPHFFQTIFHTLRDWDFFILFLTIWDSNTWPVQEKQQKQQRDYSLT